GYIVKIVSVTSFILTCKDGGPTCGTKGFGYHGIGVIYSLLCQSVHLWCVDKVIPRKSQRIPSLIICQDKNDVGGILGTLFMVLSTSHNHYCQDKKIEIVRTKHIQLLIDSQIRFEVKQVESQYSTPNEYAKYLDFLAYYIILHGIKSKPWCDYLRFSDSKIYHLETDNISASMQYR